MAKRMRTKLREIKEQLMATRHDGIDGQGKRLAQVLRGWMAYYAVPMSGSAISAFRHHMIERWHGALSRRCVELGVLPQPVGHRQRINFDTPPPCSLCTMPVQLAVMDPAQRDSELFADLAAERPRLGKKQMMSVRGRAPANQTRLGGYVSAVVLVAQANGFGSYPTTAGAGFL
jgi:hypothetical protein